MLIFVLILPNAGKKVCFAGNLLSPLPINIKWPLPYCTWDIVQMPLQMRLNAKLI